jgi:hypothetical protein
MREKDSTQSNIAREGVGGEKQPELLFKLRLIQLAQRSCTPLPTSTRTAVTSVSFLRLSQCRPDNQRY